MKEFKAVKLNENFKPTDTINWGNCGGGILVKKDENKSKVLLFNKNNLGEYAFIDVENCAYDVVGDLPAFSQLEIEKLIDKASKHDKEDFSPAKFKEYDEVELIEDSPRYTKAGVKKGMKGVILEPYAIKGSWFVIFSENDTGKDIASIAVKEQDIKLCK